MITARSGSFVCASMLAILFSTAAHAEVDAQKVADAVMAQFAGQGLPITITSAELSGANVTAKGVKVKWPEAPEAFDVGDVVLENVTEEGSGYLIGRIAAPAIQKDEDGISLDFAGASLNNIHVAGPDEADPVKKLLMYESADVGAVKVSQGGAEVFRMEGAKATMGKYEPGQPIAFDAVISGLWGDLSKIPDPKTQEGLAAMGYSTVDGTITMNGSWNPTDGRLAITEGAYDFKDVGRLNMTVDITGYTPELIKALQDMNKNMAGQDESAKGLAMLGLIQQLNFNSMAIRFDDASLTGRILDYAAKQAGQDKAAITNQTKAMIPFMVAQLQDPEFAAKVTEATSAYLDAPKSLEIKAAPAAPVPFALLIATGSTTPQALIKQLNVTVTANQ